MPPKGATTKLQPMRLPPLPKLRVRRPNQGEGNPCLLLMNSVLSTSSLSSTSCLPFCQNNLANQSTACWASAGYTSAGCQALETQLRTCMDAPVSFLFHLPLFDDVSRLVWCAVLMEFHAEGEKCEEG